MNAWREMVLYSTDFSSVEFPSPTPPTERIIHSRHIIDLLGPRITGPAVLREDMLVEHVLLLNPKYSASNFTSHSIVTDFKFHKHNSIERVIIINIPGPFESSPQPDRSPDNRIE
jgi:hypothetical protein